MHFTMFTISLKMKKKKMEKRTLSDKLFDEFLCVCQVVSDLGSTDQISCIIR